MQKFQQGGQLDEDQQEFAAFLMKTLEAKDQADFENKMSQMSEDQVKELYKQYRTMKDGVAMHKLGAKIQYLQSLKGACPEGMEVEKFLAGGCVKCRKKAEAAKQDAVAAFKEACGGKTKRIKKGADGTAINKNDTIQSKGKAYSLGNTGNGKYPKLTNSQYSKLPLKDKNKIATKDAVRGRSAN